MYRGKVPENILRRSVIKDIKVNKDVITGAAFGEDCAILNCNGQTAVSQAFGSGTDGVYYAIMRASNNLAASGYRLKYLSNVLIFPVSSEEEEIKKAEKIVIGTVSSLGGFVIGGQTEISETVKEVNISVTVIGEKISDADLSKKNILTKDTIIATKYIGLEGGAILCEKAKDKLLSGFEENFLQRFVLYKEWISVAKEGEIGAKFGVKAMKDVSEKGIFNSLWELGSACGRGMRVNLKDIPVRQELIEICNYLNINPYEMRSSGMMLMVTDNPEGLLEELRNEDIPAKAIGYFTSDNDRVIINDEEERHLDKIKQDEIYKII